MRLTVSASIGGAALADSGVCRIAQSQRAENGERDQRRRSI